MSASRSRSATSVHRVSALNSKGRSTGSVQLLARRFEAATIAASFAAEQAAGWGKRRPQIRPFCREFPVIHRHLHSVDISGEGRSHATCGLWISLPRTHARIDSDPESRTVGDGHCGRHRRVSPAAHRVAAAAPEGAANEPRAEGRRRSRLLYTAPAVGLARPRGDDDSPRTRATPGRSLEANLPAERAPAEAPARIPSADADTRGTRDPEAPPRQGQEAPVRLTTSRP